MTGKPLVADQRMAEFDPECERHHVLLVAKAVDPGCTIELQIENAASGKVRRITTAESAEEDRRAFRKALLEAFDEAWLDFALARSKGNEK